MNLFSKICHLLIFLEIVSTLSGRPACGADLNATELPAAQSNFSFPAPDSNSTMILRDTGLGLGVGVAAGILFSLMGGQNFSQPNNLMKSEAFGTGLVTGLIGGVITGLWQVKKTAAEKAAAASAIPAASGEVK